MTTLHAIQPFDDFRASLSSVRFPEVREQIAVRSDDTAFDQMREFLRERYDDVDVRHSFLEPGGEVVDCIPVEQQLALRGGSEVPEAPSEPPPPAPEGDDTAPGQATSLPPQLHPDRRDPLGNEMWCPPGTVPVLRHTLDRMAAEHATLDEFLAGVFTDPHRRHAKAQQATPNLGGASNINIWAPQQLIPPSLVSSASQQWYTNAGLPFVPFQSVECGWRAGVIEGAPADAFPRLFVFYTRDNYNTGASFYNDYSGSGFAYVAGASHILHSALTPVSQPNGGQFDIRMGFTLTGGRWWFHVSGAWIGSYPATLFSNGTLGTSALEASFGGETTTGFGSFPSMGSGKFPGEGFGKAAYQRTVAVNDLAGIAVNARLAPGQVSPACYNVAITNNTGSDWGSYLFFGGPGGLNCP